jgi:exosortase/archaeosortase family protein
MTFAKLPKLLQAAALACLALAAWVTFDLWYWWSTREDYSFGYLVPIFCGYVLYDRWPQIAALFATPEATVKAPTVTVRWMDRLGIAALVGSCLFFCMGAIYRGFAGTTLPGSFLMTTGFSGICLSGALVFSDRRADGGALTARERWKFVCLLVFPALVWIISAPLMSAVERNVSGFLLDKVTSVVFYAFDILGFTIERRANVLVLPNGEVGVEEACSGIRSLTGCLFAGSFLAAVFLDKFWKKVAMVGMALVLAFCTNLMRGLFLTGWAYAYGSKAIEGTVHDVTGYSVLGVTVVLLLCLIPLFNYKFDLPDAPKTPEPSGKNDATPAAENKDGQKAGDADKPGA